MAIKKATEKGLVFFKEVNKIRTILDEFLEEDQLNIYDIELLFIICQNEQIELRSIIQQQLIKTNQINRSVKKLFEMKLIDKKRLPEDERTVRLYIKASNRDKVEALLINFSNRISEAGLVN
ncbi:hypothetical protein ERX37_10745 [Macrococcus hajekii]|uniref:Transcriptional regulator SarA/SarZ/Rot-like helix-turn-helix domain-containing protein n=1 Tax=Macrococcus hajekii TaxID=198482 RepID=A0A4R6BHZ3_9STAP|nr:hypothetical protein [Macrococcus hajekii]TDM01148.1 hypothetical protein ERX37_10745 [Macrococcus hajekii]GGB12061.1 hypothetical protein GCM10007190_20140 [Macrococcus hajekii]